MIISISSGLNYFYTRNILIQLSAEIVDKTFESAYKQIESQVLPLINNAENTVFFLSQKEHDSSEVFNVLNESKKHLPTLLGAGLCVHYGEADSICYYFRNAEIHGAEEVISSNELYPFPFKHRKFNANSGTYRVSIQEDTISLNYFFVDDAVKIHLTYDFPLKNFLNTLDRNVPELVSRHYLFDKELNSILSTTGKFEEISNEKQRKEINGILKFLEAGNYGLYYYPDYLKRQALYSAPIKGTELILASNFETHTIANQLRYVSLVIFLISVGGLLLLVLIEYRIVIKLTRPIEELTEIGDQIRRGKLHAVIPNYQSDTETAKLAVALRTVQERMQRYVSRLNSTMKKKRAMENDLAIAEKIQLDMLPDLRRALTDIPEIDIYSMLKPAKGVAGDFFDYSFLDENRFFFIIGDVSGKGIPAALFMVKTLTLFRSQIVRQMDLDSMFGHVSDLLLLNNDEAMFVTAIGGILNYKTGELQLCDAGHNPPIRSVNGNGFEYFELEKNLPLGIMAETNYSISNYNLEHKDTLFVYTDGLPEAVNINDEMYDSERIIESLKAQDTRELEDIFMHARRGLVEFVGEAVQSDDITIILLRYLNK